MLCDAVYRADAGPPIVPNYYISPGHINTSGSRFRNPNTTQAGNVRDTLLYALNNVNVVMTPDTNEWTRCMVVESASIYHGSFGLGLNVPSSRKQGEWRGSSGSTGPDYYSRNKDMSIDSSSLGMSWFPGYAYDVETGQRVNIYFGENSFYDGTYLEESVNPGSSTGNDMIFNPTSTYQAGPFSFDEEVNFLRSVLGGQHMVYVTRQPYDSCKALIDAQESVFFIFDHDHTIYPSMDITWTSIALTGGADFVGENGELPPGEATVQLRVKRPYSYEVGTDDNSGYPMYEFSLDGLEPVKEDAEQAESALDLMRIVPNPYYAYSDYEVTEIDNVVKITNIPAACQIQIYSLDGRFIREYNISQTYTNDSRNGLIRLGKHGSNDVEDQILTSQEWDLKNYAAVPVASGVYLIRVVVPGVGERVLKSFIINRAFDAQRL